MGKNRALIIGVNEYVEDKKFNKLGYAENDADSFYQVLIDPNIGDFKKEDVTFLIGQVTKSDVEENLERILSESSKGDTVVIYFGGHGKLDKSNSLCLVTHSTKADRLLSTSVHWGVIQKMIEQSDCQSIVFLIDSCFSGAAGIRGGESLPVETIKELEKGEGRVFISASDAFQHSREKEVLQHGIFTYHLVNALAEGEADLDKDGYVSIDELYNYVYEKVRDETKGQQQPRKWGNVKGQVFVAKSIKNLERLREKIEGISNEARGLEGEGRFFDAIDIWLKVCNMDVKNEEAPRKIQEIEERLAPRCKANIDKLYEYWDNGKISDKTYRKAREIAKNCYSKLDGNEKKFARIIGAFVDDPDAFMDTWSRQEKKLAGMAEPAANVGEMRRERGEELSRVTTSESLKAKA